MRGIRRTPGPALALSFACAAAGCGWPLCDEGCGEGRRCVAGRCVAGPCADRECGPDGEGGSCGACDGLCVEGRCRRCPEEMAHVGDAAPGSCIDRYEASRGPGGRAVAAAGVLPWVRPTWLEASTACRAAGKRLCTEDEWTLACTGGAPCSGLCGRFPYGDDYEQGRCFADALASDPEPTGPVPCASRPRCEGGRPGLFDMSGNLDEWIDRCDAMSCFTAGGSYRDRESRLHCGARTPQLSGVREPDWIGDAGAELGFRCCRSL